MNRRAFLLGTAAVVAAPVLQLPRPAIASVSDIVQDFSMMVLRTNYIDCGSPSFMLVSPANARLLGLNQGR